MPLYAVDGDNTLIESSTLRRAPSSPCPSADFPKKFKTGDTVEPAWSTSPPTRATSRRELPADPGVRPDHLDRRARARRRRPKGKRQTAARSDGGKRRPGRRGRRRRQARATADWADRPGRDNGAMSALPTSLTLGSLRVDTPVVLAPMAGITNAAYRRLCAEQGAGLYVCEMITSRGLVEGDETTRQMLVFDELESVRSVQLYGTDPRLRRQGGRDPLRRVRRRPRRPQLRLPGAQGDPQGRRGSAAVEARAARRDPRARRSRPPRRTTCR